jgi:hypothetical protein
MRTFLVSKENKRPLVKWGSIPDNTFYKGVVPSNYKLGISPTPGYVIVDIDKHGKKNGFEHIPQYIYYELMTTFNYATKNKGRHCWLKYTGNKPLGNKTSKYSIDLRNERGYVAYWGKEPIENITKLTKESSPEMNEWLEELFSFKD